jgi:hypothetical protein
MTSNYLTKKKTIQKYNTIDLDFCSHEQFEKIYFKIQDCPFHGAVNFKDTNKGYHIMMICTRDCDDCRFVFDDPNRYYIDFREPEAETNVLFNKIRLPTNAKASSSKTLMPQMAGSLPKDVQLGCHLEYLKLLANKPKTKAPNPR